jgi:hypothetical protein
MVTIKEIKSTIAVSIAAAFGFIIALIWKDVIVGIMQKAGFWREGGFPEWSDAAIGAVVAVVITVISVIGIIYISKWGGVAQK